ncbi:MAG TPA: hypothetical protein PLF04_09410 [Candidatus Fermentibacter daniensis]|nr:hypothetical protein [Candidatus Fermentibacter daniensis]HPH40384.1 hypothetical protein [Candidatus Fermentibacter daniensis]HPN63491.1 hypothetical protein [Candidatus Fermentibacter daniensis]
MEITPVLLRSVISDGSVVSVSSDPGFSAPPFSIPALRDLAKRIPQNGRYSILQIAADPGLVTVAARVQAEEFFFYLLTGEGAERLASIPAFCLSRGDSLPLATPAAVALLGYTPWELSGSDFLKSFTGSPTGQSSLVTVLDRWGRRHELINMPVRQADGSIWMTVTPLPESLATGWETILTGLESRAPASAALELDSTLEAFGATGGAVFEKQGDSYAMLASRNSPVTEDDFAPGGLLSNAGVETSEWIDSGENDASGHVFIKSFGRSGMFMGVFYGAPSPLALEHKASVILPILAMRLELASATRARVELESRKSVLESIEKLLHDRGVSSWQDLPGVLDDIAAQTGASRIEVTTSQAGQTAGMSTAAHSDALPDAATLDVKMLGGRLLRIRYDSQRHADTGMAKAVARLFERFCRRDQAAPVREPASAAWKAAYMEGFKVLWQPEGSSLQSCFSFYGREAPCEGCPVLRSFKGEKEQASAHFRDGWIEEMQQCGQGHSIRWTRWIPDPSEPGSERMPGGTAIYDRSGTVLSWNAWMDTVAGVASATVRGQAAARHLDRIAGPRIVRQLELAMADVFLPDSIEVALAGGRRCFSKMSPGPGKGQIFHLMLDERSAGIEEIQILSGPGSSGAEGEPSSFRSALASVCEIYGWEFLPTEEASSGSTEVWLSSQALSEYLLDLLRQMAPMMPDRKASLRIAEVPEGRMLSGRTIFPALYGIAGFRTYPVILPGQSALLASMERDIAGLGGWMAKTSENGIDEVMVAFPITGRDLGERRQVTVYSTDDWFTAEIEAVMQGLSEPFCLASNLPDLSEMQLASRALVIRPRPGEHGIVSCLAARVPGQSIILASGVKPRIPLTVSSVMHLQVPASRDEMLAALRRMILV